MHPCIYPSVLSIYLSIYLSVNQSINQSIYLSTYVGMCGCMYVCMHACVCMYVSCMYVSMYLSLSLAMYRSPLTQKTFHHKPCLQLRAAPGYRGGLRDHAVATEAKRFGLPGGILRPKEHVRHVRTDHVYLPSHKSVCIQSMYVYAAYAHTRLWLRIVMGLYRNYARFKVGKFTHS